MKLTRIEIGNYKSIRSPLTLHFTEDMPTVLIGKNGSGKTNCLEALSKIVSANTSYGYTPTGGLSFRAYFRLSREEAECVPSDIGYDKEKCEIGVCCERESLTVSRFVSESTPSLGGEIGDTNAMISELKYALGIYVDQLSKISGVEGSEPPFCDSDVFDECGEPTDHATLKRRYALFIEKAADSLDRLEGSFERYDPDMLITTCYAFIYEPPKPFELRCKEDRGDLTPSEKDELNHKIEKFNRKTKDAADRICLLIEKIRESAERIEEGLYDSYIKRRKSIPHAMLLREARYVIGNRCFYLENESRDSIFGKPEKNIYHGAGCNYVIDTYLERVYTGSDRDELLNSPKNKLELSDAAAAELEAYLNEHIPEFDKDMYSISVQSGAPGHVPIFLIEKSGERVNLDNTSAGRRWYFTFYFMKSIMREGDTFIIDEPASMLHPTAQREVLSELKELAARGIRVVYATHSPYLIPDEWQCVHFVTMTDRGTEINCVSSNREFASQMTEIVGDDIFDVQAVVDAYARADRKRMAKRCYDAVLGRVKKVKNLPEAASELLISVDAIKSWNRNGDHFRCPELENIMAVSRYANIKIKDLLN